MNELVRSGGLCKIGYPSETHLKPKSCEISFVDNLLLSYPVLFAVSRKAVKFNHSLTQLHSHFQILHRVQQCLLLLLCTATLLCTAMLCANYQNVISEQNFKRFDFKMSV